MCSNFYVKKPLKVKGLTIIEMLFSLSLITVMMFASISVYQLIFKKNELVVRTSELNRIIKLVRTKSLSMNKSLVLKPLSSDNWSEGVGLYDKAELLQAWQWRAKQVDVQWHGFQSRDYLIFSPNLRKSALNGHFYLRSKGMVTQLHVNRLGRIRTTT